MIKKLLLAALFAFFLLFPKSVGAQEQFQIDIAVDYKVEASGTTQVTHTVTLKNLVSNLYATSYTLSLNNINPINVVAFQGSTPLNITTAKSQDSTNLRVNFDDSVVGKDKSRTFSISFKEGSFATKTGEVWEISIPRLSENNFNTYQVNLAIPESFGQEAYISPGPDSKESSNGYYNYVFGKNSVEKSGIVAGFGKFQVFSFNLNYHLENPLNLSAYVEIAIPPDTAYQRVYYEILNPVPVDIYIDSDGNWIAKYKLKSRERVDVNAAGSVQIFSEPRQVLQFSQDTLEKNLKPTEYWQSNNIQIVDLANSLKTPSAIYKYVSETLKYDYERVKPNVERLGALEALNSPNTAICMEYTDLFIALARAAGIPAREVNGYAYTENPEIQPLSLVADVLHAWPEYWDSSKSLWVPVDPTWGSTTGGVDFFNKLDLRHFTFVIHGEDDLKPYPPGSYKLGPNPQKDVFVNFGQLPQERNSKPQIIAEPKTTIPFANSKLRILVENPGPVALYDLYPEVYFDNSKEASFYIDALPPYSQKEFSVTIPFSFLGTNTPEKVLILVADSRVEVPTFKSQVIVYNLLVIFLGISALVVFVMFRIKKISLKRFIENSFSKIKTKYGKEDRQNKEDLVGKN